jgi:hypothetical protein
LLTNENILPHCVINEKRKNFWSREINNFIAKIICWNKNKYIINTCDTFYLTIRRFLKFLCEFWHFSRDFLRAKCRIIVSIFSISPVNLCIYNMK